MLIIIAGCLLDFLKKENLFMSRIVNLLKISLRIFYSLIVLKTVQCTFILILSISTDNNTEWFPN